MPSEAARIKEILFGRGWLGEVDQAVGNEILEAGRLVRLPKGRALFGPDDAAEGVFGVVSGGIVLSTTGIDGYPAPGHIMRAGNWFGYGSVLVKQRRTLLAEASESSEVLYLPLGTVRRFRESGQEFVRAFALLPSYGEAILLAIVADLLIPNSDRRLASVLLRITGAADQDDEVPTDDVPLTHDLLGQLGNASRHTVARFAKRMSGEGLILWRYGQVRILNVRGLTLFANSGH